MGQNIIRRAFSRLVPRRRVSSGDRAPRVDSATPPPAAPEVSALTPSALGHSGISLTPASVEAAPQGQNRGGTAGAVRAGHDFSGAVPTDTIDQHFQGIAAPNSVPNEGARRPDLEPPHPTTMSESDRKLAPPDTFSDDVSPAAKQSDAFAWQQEALDAWHQQGRRGIVETLTGDGTIGLGVMAADEAVRQGVKVLVLVPTLQVQSQWFEDLRLRLPNVRTGALGSGASELAGNVDVLVATFKSTDLEKNVRSHNAGLVIADEWDKCGGPPGGQPLENECDWRLGLTAVLEEPDCAYQEQSNQFFGGIVYSLKYDRALRDGAIAPFDLTLLGIDLAPEEMLQYSELSDDMAEAARYLELYADVSGSPLREFTVRVATLAGEAESRPVTVLARKYLKMKSSRLALLAETKAKRQALAALSDIVTESSDYIVFTQTDEANELPDADLGIVVSASRSQKHTGSRLGRLIQKKADGRHGRLVVLFTKGTVEDPDIGGAEFLRGILPYARRVTYLDLETDVNDLWKYIDYASDSRITNSTWPKEKRSGANVEPTEAADGCDARPTGIIGDQTESGSHGAYAAHAVLSPDEKKAATSAKRAATRAANKAAKDAALVKGSDTESAAAEPEPKERGPRPRSQSRGRMQVSQ